MKVNLQAQRVTVPTVFVTKGRQRVKQYGNTIYLKNGDEFEIELFNPTTGKVLKELSNTVAVVTISDTDANSATGTVTKGLGVKIGDSVSKVTTEVSAIIIPPAASTPAGNANAAPAAGATGSPTSKPKNSAPISAITKKKIN